ncbi:MAG: ArsR/SmtB family transcription factor [Thermoplasmata archaeon]
MRQEIKVIREPEVIEIALEETRRKILSLLSVSDMTVSQLVDILEKDQSTVYRHIEKMLEAGLVYVVGERKRRHIPEKIYGRTASVFILSPDLEDKRESSYLIEFEREQAERLAKIFYGMGVLKKTGEEVENSILEFLDSVEKHIAPYLARMPSEISLSPQGAWRLKTILVLYCAMHEKEFHDKLMNFFDENFV